MILLKITDVALFVLFAVNILYLFVFSLASLRSGRKPNINKNYPQRRFVILIPAYREDEVIHECVESCLAQNTDRSTYDVVVISDSMDPKTNDSLRTMPIRVLEVNFKNSTKAKALNFAMDQLDDSYQIAVVLDADNTIEPDFLQDINTAFADPNVEIIQAHRCAKNMNTPLAILDTISEEINNSIFRRGHANLGLSAALIGSGMCFDYQLFKQTMLSINAVGGFDRALELNLLGRGKRIGYLEHTIVLDEKVQHSKDFSNQRRRWMSAQVHYLRQAIGRVPSAIAHGRWDFCDKVFQQMSIPRMMLIGFCFIIAVLISFISIAAAIKWWILFAILTLSLLIAIPGRLLFNRKIAGAVIRAPYFFVLMSLNLFKLRGANKKFIHTKHGVKK